MVWLYRDVTGTMLLHQEDVWTEHDSFLGVGEVERDVARAVLTSLLRDEEIIFILGKPFVLSCLLSIQHKHCPILNSLHCRREVWNYISEDLSS